MGQPSFCRKAGDLTTKRPNIFSLPSRNKGSHNFSR